MRGPKPRWLGALIALTSCHRGTPRSSSEQPLPTLDRTVLASLRSTSPVDDILARLPDDRRRAARTPVEHYVECLAGTDSSQCSRLGGQGAQWCREASAQVAARASNQPHWFGVPGALAVCAQYADANDCRRYASAVERNEPDDCPPPGRVFQDCRAVASGVEALCSSLVDSGDCIRAVRDVRGLRLGIATAARESVGVVRYVSIGAVSGRNGCDALLRSEWR